MAHPGTSWRRRMLAAQEPDGRVTPLGVVDLALAGVVGLGALLALAAGSVGARVIRRLRPSSGDAG